MTYAEKKAQRRGHYTTLDNALADARNRGLIAPYTTLAMIDKKTGGKENENRP